MALTPTQKTEAYQFFIVAFGAATGVEYMNQLNDAYGAGMTTKQIVNVYTTKPQFEAQYPRFLTNDQFADKLIENVVGASATAAAKAEAKADVAAALNAGWTKGDVVFQIFTNLAAKAPTDAMWGNTSLTLANKVAVAQYVTETLLVNTTDLAKLAGLIANVTQDPASVVAAEAAASGANGQTFTLTTGADTFVGTSGNDTFVAGPAIIFDANGAPVNVATAQTLDSIDGGAGIDTLKLTAITAAPALPQIQNIEIIEAQSIAGLTIDTSTVAGLTNLNVTKAAGAVAATAAATTDVSVAMKAAGAAVGVVGGKNVTVKLTDVAAAADVITVGAGTAAKGDVVVEVAGKAYAATDAAHALSAINVTGGKTISVTQKASSNIAAAAADTTNVAVTQGAVNITGNADTTTVTVKQDAAVAAKNAANTTGGVTESASVKFGVLKSGDVLAAGGLTFTAKADMTAAEVAAVFANLVNGTLPVAGDTQGSGLAGKGTYTGVFATSGANGFTSAAASGDTVVFTAATANAVVANLGFTLTNTSGTSVAPVVTTTEGKAHDATATGGVMGVVAGAVTVADAAGTIKTVTVDGYSAAGSALTGGAVLDTLNLSNGGVFTTANAAAALNLTLEKVNGLYTQTAGAATLNVKSVGANTAGLDAANTTALNVSGSGLLNASTGSVLTNLKTIKVTETAGLNLGATALTNVTSVDTTGTTGAVTVAINSTTATYTGGAGVDNVTFSNTTAASKAVSLGAGDDTLTLAAGTTAVPTVTIDGGAGVDTLAMAAADAATATAAFSAKFTSFEKLSLGAVANGATNIVDLSNLNNINYVISAGSALVPGVAPAAPVGVATAGGAAAEFTTFTFGAGLAAGESFTIDGVTVTASAAKTAAEVAGFFRDLATPVAGLTSTGSYATPPAWTGAPIVGGATNTLILTNTVVGDVTDFTAATSVGVPVPGTGALTLTKMANAGTLELTGAGTGAVVTMADATSLTADVLNVVTKLSTANLNYGTVDAAGVETINLSINDTAATTALGGIQTATLNLKDAALQTITVTGNANLTLTNDVGNVAVKMLDASAFTGVLTASTNGTVAQTIQGGSGNDVLTVSGGKADVLIGGAGADTLVAGSGLATLTGGAGNDLFVIGTASANVNSYATITDFAAGDLLKISGATTFASAKVALGDTAVFQDYANEAINGLANTAAGWFQFGGNTYVVADMGGNTTVFTENQDFIVKLTGLVDLTNASFNAAQGTIALV